MIRYRLLTTLLLCLSFSSFMRAQGYDAPDVGRFHESSVYFVTLQDASGANINGSYARTERCIGAFVGDELRGTSEVTYTSPTGAESVFMIRAWGDDKDPKTIDLRIRDGELEYKLKSLDFDPTRETDYGQPSNPIVLQFIPITSMQLSQSSISVQIDDYAYITPSLVPENHTELVTDLQYIYKSDTENVFTVDQDGKIYGKASGSGILKVSAVDGEDVVFSASATVSVFAAVVHVTSMKNNMESLDIVMDKGDEFKLDFTVLPENATDRTVTYSVGDINVVAYYLDDRGNATFQALNEGSTTIKVTSNDNKEATLTYNVTVKPVLLGLEIQDEISVELGETIDLKQLVNPLPESFNLDYNDLVWESTDGKDYSEYIKLEDNKLTGVKINVGGVYMTVKVKGTDISANTRIYVLNSITSITVKEGYETIIVDQYDKETLTQKIYDAFIFEPEDNTDWVMYEVENNQIVTWNWSEFDPVKAGETYVSAVVYDVDENEPTGLKVRLSAKVKVIVNPVTLADEAAFKKGQIKCNVGDDITDVLKQLMYFSPEDATDRRVTFTVETMPGESEEVMEEDQNGRFIALHAGTAIVTSQYVAKPELQSYLYVVVVNPATDFYFKQDKMTFGVKLNDNSATMQIAQEIKDNIVFTPEDFNCFGDLGMNTISDHPVFTASDDKVLGISSSATSFNDYDIMIDYVNEGTTDITVRLEIPDYLHQALSETDEVVAKVVEKKFKLEIIPKLTYFELPEVIYIEKGKSLDLKQLLKPMPENVEFDYDKLVWEFDNFNYDEYIKIENNILYGLQPYLSGVYVYLTYKDDPNVFGSTTIKVMSYTQSITVRPGYENITVELGDAEDLKEKINNAFIILPEDHNDEVWYESDDEDIVQVYYGGTYFDPKKKGKTKVSANVSDPNDEKYVRLSASVNVEVVKTTPTHVESIVPSTTERIAVSVGDIINPYLIYTVLPEDADDKSVTLEIINPDIIKRYWPLDLNENGEIYAKYVGNASVKIISNDNPEAFCLMHFAVTDEVDDVAITFPDEIEISKFADKLVEFSKSPSGAAVKSNYVYIDFEDSPHPFWGATATASLADPTGLKWNFRGRYAGTYKFTVTYRSEKQKSEKGNDYGIVHIPAEYVFEDGWDWISIYAAPQGGIPLTDENGEYLASMQLSNSNKVIEIRSQKEQLYNDPQYGFFGTISALTPQEGMYKIYSQHSESKAYDMRFSAGYKDLIDGDKIGPTVVQPGYTWITYPHELDHKFQSISQYLRKTAADGDLIIGRDYFAEFNGQYWEAPEVFKFQAGKGYIYYTESTAEKEISWGDEFMEPDSNDDDDDDDFAPWRYRPGAYPESMPVVAVLNLDEIDDDCVIGAFVGEECRGVGHSVGSEGRIHVSVTGQRGDIVTFRLFDKATGKEIPLRQHVNFDAKAGSHRYPVKLSTTAINEITDESESPVFDLQGRKADQRALNSKGVSLGRGVYIKDGRKYIVK